MTTSPADLVEVTLLQLPLALRARSAAHSSELMREMELMSIGRETGTTRAVPQRLLQLAQELREVYGPFVDAVDEELDAATDRGEVSVPEVRYLLPPTTKAFLEQIVDVLDELEDFCRQGKHLLLLAAPPDVAAYRDWSIGEVLRQLDGHAATPWPVFAGREGSAQPPVG